MVAAAKLRRAQTAVVSARPYARKMSELLAHLTANVDVSASPLVAQREPQSVAVIVVTSDRGLCGAFNSNLIKAAVQHINTRYEGMQAAGTLKVFCVGKKGQDVFAKRHYKIAGRYVGLYANLVFSHAQAIAREVVDGFLRGEFDRVDVVYNEFKTVAQQKVVIEQFLPIPMAGTAPGSSSADYIYEPSQQSIVEALMPRHLNFQIWRILLESYAAEQGSRMAAMENATTNANELISALQLSYNKARQASITKELLEVVSGANAQQDAG